MPGMRSSFIHRQCPRFDGNRRVLSRAEESLNLLQHKRRQAKQPDLQLPASRWPSSCRDHSTITHKPSARSGNRSSEALAANGTGTRNSSATGKDLEIDRIARHQRQVPRGHHCPEESRRDRDAHVQRPRPDRKMASAWPFVPTLAIVVACSTPPPPRRRRTLTRSGTRSVCRRAAGQWWSANTSCRASSIRCGSGSARVVRRSRRAGEVSPQMTPSGIVIVMSRRLSAAVAPWRWAQAAGERIQSGMPAGTSNSGISTRSLGAKASP